MDLLVIAILGTLIGTILALEAATWIPYLSRRLVRSALSQMPAGLDENLRKRWSEEIEADFGSYSDRPLGGLIFALRLWRQGGRRLAAELMLDETIKAGTSGTGKSDVNIASVDGRLIEVSFPKGSDPVLTYELPEGRVVSTTVLSDGSGAPDQTLIKIHWQLRRSTGGEP